MAEHSLMAGGHYGIELIHPRREGRSDSRLARKVCRISAGSSGCKLCYGINHLVLIVDWDVDTANVYDGTPFKTIVEDVMNLIWSCSPIRWL